MTVAGNPVGALGAGVFRRGRADRRGARIAEVTADTEMECFTLAAWQFRPFVQDHPDVAWALIRPWSSGSCGIPSPAVWHEPRDLTRPAHAVT